MISEKAVEAIELAVNFEHNKITTDHGEVYASKHEAYAVLLEEKEEAEDELECMKVWLESTWKTIRNNTSDTLLSVNKVKEHAILLIQEAVQCAAVCERFIETLERED